MKDLRAEASIILLKQKGRVYSFTWFMQIQFPASIGLWLDFKVYCDPTAGPLQVYRNLYQASTPPDPLGNMSYRLELVKQVCGYHPLNNPQQPQYANHMSFP
ncbi:hypothetical protein SK128_018904 [Halocaridina rubra]|uniref:Uncharacterized protein n=1 Tax=Halocaridina rubra TaxID=373956 RepID=A0AAN8X2Z3_HALRR